MSNSRAAGCLPIRFHDWCHPLDRAEPFITALGPSPVAIRWDLNAWPEIPEVGLEYITLPHDHHRARIEWLATQVGGRYTGRVELSPL